MTKWAGSWVRGTINGKCSDRAGSCSAHSSILPGFILIPHLVLLTEVKKIQRRLKKEEHLICIWIFVEWHFASLSFNSRYWSTNSKGLSLISCIADLADWTLNRAKNSLEVVRSPLWRDISSSTVCPKVRDKSKVPLFSAKFWWIPKPFGLLIAPAGGFDLMYEVAWLLAKWP